MAYGCALKDDLNNGKEGDCGTHPLSVAAALCVYVCVSRSTSQLAMQKIVCAETNDVQH